MRFINEFSDAVRNFRPYRSQREPFRLVDLASDVSEAGGALVESIYDSNFRERLEKLIYYAHLIKVYGYLEEDGRQVDQIMEFV